MLLPEVYDAIRPALVFFTPKVRLKGDNAVRSRVPPIVGTGFVVGEGLVVTNDHVIQAFENLSQPPGGRGVPVYAHILHPHRGGLARVAIEVLASMVIAPEEQKDDVYGSVVPDIGVVAVHARGLPRIEVTRDLWPLPEGTPIATAGFPMGENMMVAGEHLTQMAPTLQAGIVSALTPYRSETARGFVVDITSYGGASGSPVFLADRPLVVGLLYAGLDYPVHASNDPVVMVPTPFSYCASGTDVFSAVEVARTKHELEVPGSAPTIERLIEQQQEIIERRLREGEQG